MDRNELLERVKKALKEMASKANAASLEGPTPWTRGVSEALARLGRDLGYKVCNSNRDIGDDSEWLYDMVWYKYREGGEPQRLDRIPLVMECEWHVSISKLTEDFEKLLLANADLRVFVCNTREQDRETMRIYYRDSIEGYLNGHPGDLFLIATMENESGEFDFDPIVKGGT